VLDDVLLQRFASEFFGYGRVSAPFWFIGMEEAGAADEREAQQRLDAWVALGSKAIVDCADFHQRVADDKGPMERYFRGGASIQPTWGPLIRFFLRAIGRLNITTDSVRGAQTSGWGRSNSDNCLVELLPLPSPNADDWLYSEWSSLPHLMDRDLYRSHFLETRIAKLRDMIQEHRPRVVLFYGNRYLTWWSEVSGLQLSKADRVAVCKNSKGRKLYCRIS
jgi:hypothetical protein